MPPEQSLQIDQPAISCQCHPISMINWTLVMRLDSMQIEGLRSIGSLTIGFSDVTAVLGGNNSGKSTILKALELFFESSPKLKDEDFFRSEADEIVITVTFCELTESEKEEFGTAIVGEKMTIRRSLSRDKDRNLQYSALALSYPKFAEVRAAPNKTAMRSMFNKLADEMDGLEKAANADQVEERMRQWEASNPDHLELEFRRAFFGVPNVANGKLKKHTALHLIPAVADASEETGDQRHSPIVLLLSSIARSIYQNKREVKEFIDNTSSEWGRLTDVSNYPELSGINESLTSSIQRYYRDSRLVADWLVDDGLTVNFPRPEIRVEDHGHKTIMENVGHGLQRACLFAIIQFLAEMDSKVEGDDFAEPQSDIILLIEEPEIYQHPHKQEVICGIIHEICRDFSRRTGIRFQIIFTTHSEKFVSIQNFQSLRILRRQYDDGERTHAAASLSIGECSKYFADLLGVHPMTDAAFQAKMHIFSREVCEGFFASKVIIVEGVTDKAVVDGYYRSKGRNCLSEGVVIVPMEGKTKIDKPFFIFSQLGIPVFALFDNDRNTGDKAKKTNRLIQRVAGVADPVDFPAGCGAKICAFEGKLEKYLREQAAGSYDKVFQEIADFYGLDVKDISKTPHAVSEVVVRCQEAGQVFPLFDDVVNAVDHL